MCLVLLDFQPGFPQPVLLLGNRDEFHERASSAAQPWSESPSVIGGRDLQAHGSWLGVCNDGRWAAILNRRQWPPPKRPRSRGWLVRDFLLSHSEAEFFARETASQAEHYGPFLLLLGHADQAWIVDGNRSLAAPLAAGLHVLSNGPPDQQWPKQRHLRAAYIAARSQPDSSSNTLLELLQDETPAAEQELPDTGVGPVRERLLSPIFIRGDIYGTRASTLFCLTDDGCCHLVERSFAANGSSETEQHWSLTSPHAAWQPG